MKSSPTKDLLGLSAVVVLTLLSSHCAFAGNPITSGWYADPEIRIFDHQYWIYPTYSADDGPPDVSSAFTKVQDDIRKRKQVWPVYLKQTFFNAFSSPDLVHWTKHEHVLDVQNVAWAAAAVWAPSVIEVHHRYYMFFGANDIQSDDQLGGLGVAVSERPGGPFIDAIGKPLIGSFHNGAQPIDPFVFRDDNGTLYLYYGGWNHCNVARLAPDLKSIIPLPSGEQLKEITPPGYVEGSFVIKRKGLYYLMWSEGDWTTPDYRVAYATGPTPLGPFKPGGVILAQDFNIAQGAGHHSVVNIPGTDDWFIVYHRRPLGDKDGNHRALAIDEMHFRDDGSIIPVRMTNEGVPPRPLP